MPIKRSHIKRGLQRLETTSWEWPLSKKDIAELDQTVQESSIEQTIASYEEAARIVLREANFPDHLGPFVVTADGDWRDMPQEWRKGAIPKPTPGETFSIQLLTSLLRGRELSPEWRAAQILRYADVLKQHMAKGDITNVVWAALHLQKQVERAMLSTAWERDAITGQRVREGGRKGYKRNREAATRIALHKEWVSADLELASTCPDVSAAERARRIAQCYGENPETARNAIWRFRKRSEENPVDHLPPQQTARRS